MITMWRNRTVTRKLNPRQLAALRQTVACRGCGAVRRDVPTGGTKITHTRACTAPPERAYDR